MGELLTLVATPTSNFQLIRLPDQVEVVDIDSHS